MKLLTLPEPDSFPPHDRLDDDEPTTEDDDDLVAMRSPEFKAWLGKGGE